MNSWYVSLFFLWNDDKIVIVRLEHYPVEKLKKEIIEIIGRRLDLSKYRVFFFGSRVAGGGTVRSDIDVGIEGVELIPAAKWLDILEEIENIPTLYKIEIVDFFRTAPVFKEVALQKTESISI